MQDFDIAIVGAGPAGSSTAITLAELGHDVVLLDRAIFPRDKLCGDFLNPINWPILRELNVSQAVLRCPHTKVSSFRLTAAAGLEARSSLPSQGKRQFGLGVRRYHLDHVLVERAKKLAVEVKEGVKIRAVEKASRGWVLDIDDCGDLVSLRAKVMVGADGRNSWVALRLGLAPRQETPLGSVGFEVQLKIIAGLDGSVEIHQFPGGYAGLVRVDDDTVNLCFTVKRSLLGKSVSYANLRDRFLRHNPLLENLLARSEPVSELRSVSPVYFSPRQCYGDGFLLVGDAARVTEPVTGEGIYLALKSGQLAAKAIDDALRRNDVSATCLSPYDRACRAEFRARLRRNYLIRALMYQPRLLPSLIRFFRKRRQLLESLLSAVCLPRAERGAG